MADGNKFKETVESLFQGMDSVVSSKTVVGDASISMEQSFFHW